jgi:hypothetical protein
MNADTSSQWFSSSAFLNATSWNYSIYTSVFVVKSLKELYTMKNNDFAVSFLDVEWLVKSFSLIAESSGGR